MYQGSSRNLTMSKLDRELCRKTKFTDDYKVLKKLGSGTFAEVFLVQNKSSGAFECAKVIFRKLFRNVSTSDILNEIKTLAELDHPNIMKIFCYYETEKHYYILSEFLSGGELFEHISKAKRFTEFEAAKYMEQILKAVAFLHEHGIVHRDLKPENIVFDSPNIGSTLKIVDFGTSKSFIDNQVLRSQKGTADYMAPEVLESSYDNKCDIWSCGVILYVFLYGYLPFNGADEEEVLEKIHKGKYKFSENIKVSDDAKNMIKMMLSYKPSERPSANQVLQSPWLKKMKTDTVDFKGEINIIKNFKRTLNEKDVIGIFQAIDKDNSGYLDKEELFQFLGKLNPEDAQKMSFIASKSMKNDQKGISQRDFSDLMNKFVNK